MDKKSLLLKLFVAVLLLCFSLTVYIPQLIYFAQKEYFDYSFLELVYRPFLVGFLGCIILLAFFSLFSTKLIKFVSAFFLLVASLVWLQADLFNLSYGVIDGMEIDFEHYNARGNVELLVLFLAVFVVALFNKAINKHLPTVVVLIFIAQVALTAFNILTDDRELVEETKINDEFFQLSSEKNILLIVLDTFGGEIFQQILADNPDAKNGLDGFVNYTDAISNYPATAGSLPSILTGKLIPQNTLYRTFLTDVVPKEGLPALFDEKGYAVSVVSVKSGFKEFYEPRFIHEPMLQDEDLALFQMMQLYDYSFFRVLPHYVKPMVFNEGQWTFSRYFANDTEVPNTHAEKGAMFLELFTENMTLKDSQPRFKLIHLGIPHAPFVYNKDCEKNKISNAWSVEEKMYQQSTCAFRKLEVFLSKLKALNAYDNSLIVVTSDHGARLYTDRSQSGFPSYREMKSSGILFMVKGIGQKQKFKEVNSQFSLKALKNILLESSNHTTALDNLYDPERMFYSYRNNLSGAKGYMNDAPLFKVGADYTNPESWELKKFVINNCKPKTLPLYIKFNSSSRNGDCAKYGFLRPEPKGIGTWTESDDVRVIFSLDEGELNLDDFYALEIDLKPQLFKGREKIDLKIYLNEELIGVEVLKIKEKQKMSYKLSGSLLKTQLNEIKIIMPGLKSKKEIGQGTDTKKVGLLISQIAITKK